MHKNISWDNPDWLTTFPHRVTPNYDEWLPGLLLRCDKFNHWPSRTTLHHVLHSGPEKFHRCWRTETPNLAVIVPHSLNIDTLAQLLSVSADTILNTTYHVELSRLFGNRRRQPKFLSPSFLFHLCPCCLADASQLKRTLALPNISICPAHRVMLQQKCSCGMPLHLFPQGIPPFSCYNCGLSWTELPSIRATSEHTVRLEQKLLAWYEFFFSQGNPLMLQAALQLMTGSRRKQLPLSTLVDLLVKRGRSPQDVVNWMNRLSLLRREKN
jgi:TniQ